MYKETININNNINEFTQYDESIQQTMQSNDINMNSPGSSEQHDLNEYDDEDIININKNIASNNCINNVSEKNLKLNNDIKHVN